VLAQGVGEVGFGFVEVVGECSDEVLRHRSGAGHGEQREQGSVFGG
jgi:hypothetical protein